MTKTATTPLYTVTPADPSGHRFTVQLHVPEPDAAGQELSLPAWIPGSYLIRDFARHIETLEARDDDGPVAVRKLDNHRWQCAPARGALRVGYTVYAWDLSVRGAHLDDSHGFFNGTSLFLCVHGQEARPCLVHLRPPPHNRHWNVYTSLPAAKGHPQAAKRHGFGVYLAPDYDALIDHPVEMGTPQVVEFEANGVMHEMVFTGVIPNLDLARIADDTRKICEAQMALFGHPPGDAPFLDSAPRYVFMTMVTADGYGGLEHRASTALMAPRNQLPTIGTAKAPEGYTTFLGLVSHEYFHTWHVKRIKPARFVPYQLQRETHTRLLWVFEGFTSYYDDLMLLRSGCVTEAEYFSLLAKTITSVHRGNGRLKQSVAESSFDAWTRYYRQDENAPNAIVSYYTKGALVALGLDLLIRHSTNGEKSLDDVMRHVWRHFGQGFYKGQEKGIEEDAMAGLILEATGVDASDYLEQYVDDCLDIPLDDLLGREGVQLLCEANSGVPSLDARLQEAHGETRLASVFEGGAAHTHGLSAGDTLVAINGLRVGAPASAERLLAAYRPGQEVDIHVFRRDELRAYRVKLAKPPRVEYKLVREPA